jgi:hypothetical protein
MNGLPSNVDLSFLFGRILLQLCIGLHDLILNFDGDVAISIESSLGFGIRGKKEKPLDVLKDNHHLTGLLQVPVSNPERDDNGGLFLFFENESYLHIHNDSKDYESFVIKYKGTFIIA